MVNLNNGRTQRHITVLIIYPPDNHHGSDAVYGRLGNVKKWTSLTTTTQSDISAPCTKPTQRLCWCPSLGIASSRHLPSSETWINNQIPYTTWTKTSYFMPVHNLVISNDSNSISDRFHNINTFSVYITSRSILKRLLKLQATYVFWFM